MVLSKKIFKYLKSDQTYLEREPLEKLSNNGQLYAFKHNGFWQCMDTLRDKEVLKKVLNKKNILRKKKIKDKNFFEKIFFDKMKIKTEENFLLNISGNVKIYDKN